MNFKIIPLIFILVIFQGCSSKVELTGEVFIEDQNTVKKLPLTSIQIVSKEKFIQHINGKLKKAKSEERIINKSIADLKNYNEKFDALAKRSAKLVMQKEIDELIEFIVEIEASVRKLELKLIAINNGGSSIYYSDSIDGAVAKTTTNSDGKFKITYEEAEEDKLILVAVKDELVWALWLKPKDGKLNISLSNSNTAGSNCLDCVFSKRITPNNITPY